MATGGHAVDPQPAVGTGEDEEPTWPAWISDPITINWIGWKRVDVPLAKLTYRHPANAAADAAPANFADADAIGIDTSRRKGVLYISMLAWDGADGTEATSIPADDFSSQSYTAWRVHGTPQAVRAVSYRTAVTPPVAHIGHPAMKLSFVNAALNDAQSMVYLKQMASLATRPCVVFCARSPFDPQLPDAMPVRGDAATRVEAFACADQIQSAAFSIYALKPLTNVTVRQEGGLSKVGHDMPSWAVDIDVVKVAKQHGDAEYVDWDATGLVPGMLVKDDRETLRTADGSLPNIRFTGDPVTDIPANTQKQFWLTLNVPKNTPAGNYTEQLEISADQLSPFSISLYVDILPLRLMSPSKQYAVAFEGKLSAPPQSAGGADPGATLAASTEYLSGDTFREELSDIANHGFRYATLTDQGPAFWDAAQQYMAVPGLGYPFLYTGFTSLNAAEAIDRERSDHKIDPFYFLDSNTGSLGQDAAAFKAAGLQDAVIVPDDNSLPDGIDSASLAIHHVDDPYVKRLLAGGQRTSNQRDWLAWQSSDCHPLVNRLYTGYLLFRSDMYGAYALGYECAYGGDPYDDTAPRAAAYTGLRPQMLTFPVAGGLIDTVQWEAAREGVNDIRYLTTFYAALRECKDNHVDGALVPTYESAVKQLMQKPFWSEDDADLQHIRLTIAQYAVRLRSDVDHYYAKHGGS